MALELSAEERQFQQEVQDFVAERLPDAIREKVKSGTDLTKEDYVEWQRILAARGWLVVDWPVEEGGAGFNPVQRYIFEEEMARAGAPQVNLTLAVGPRLLGPILCAHGTPEQRAFYLPRIRSVTDWWCQGYSEPDAGSDLAALRMRATKDGDDYLLTGQKIWQSYGHWADRMVCLARTDVKAVRPQAGISFFLVDLHLPGVEVRPIRTINGRSFFNEVVLDQVRVSTSDRVGPENAGWAIAKNLLGHERLGAARVGETKKRLAELRACARRTGAWDRSWLRKSYAGLAAEARAIEVNVLSFLEQIHGDGPAGPEISMLKLRGTELLQRIMDLHAEIAGAPALWGDQPPLGSDFPERGLWPNHLYTRGFTIAAGTSEIQRNILARHILGRQSSKEVLP